MAKSDGEQQGQHLDQQISVVSESPAAAAIISAATLPKPTDGNKTTLHLAAAATATNFYNRPTTLPPFLYTAMPYAPHTAVAMPTMMPPTTVEMNLLPVTTATKRTTSKSGGEKPTKKQRLTLTAKSTMMDKNNDSSENLSIPSSDKIALSSSSASASVPQSSTSLAALRKLSDTEFTKYVASEFKRRGYIAAIQLKPFSSKMESGGIGKGSANKKRKGKQNDDNENETATETDSAEAAAVASSVVAATATSAATSTTTAATATTTINDDFTPTTKKSSKQSLTPTRKSQRPPSPSLSLPSFSFFPSLSTPNSKQDATWDAMYRQLCDFMKKQDGKLPLSLSHSMPMIEEPTAATTTSSPAQLTTAANTNTPDTAATTNNINSTNDSETVTKKQYEALYKWTKKQLSSWIRMKTDSGHNLSLERISKLHALNFEQFCTRLASSSSSANLAAANAVPAPPAPEAAAIADALSSVGVGNYGMGNRIDVDPDKSVTNAQKWQEKFESLKRYKELYGDTNVSRLKDEVLSRWCATQRVRCKLTPDTRGGAAAAAGEVTMSDTKKNPLTREQFQQLESIGFGTSAKRKKYDRSVLDRKWEEKFQELVRFKEEHGHCDVAIRKGFENLKQLATWAGLQRQKYRAKLSGSKSGRTTDITDEQIMKLGSIGFTFTLQDDFETRFNQLCQFKKEFGHTKVPVFYTGHNNLGRWAKRMRDGIRNSEPWMDEVRKTRLLGIDFDIAARRVFDHAPKKAVATSTNTRVDNSEFDFYYNDYHQGSL